MDKNTSEMNNDIVSKTISSYSRFVSSQMFQLLDKKNVTEINLGDQKEIKLTILFSDIRDFTTLSESLKPKENFDFINAYLYQMDLLINEHFGIIDKFMGDGIMAIFPKNADNALDCSIRMIKQLEHFNSDRKNNNQAPIKIGIGLNTGLSMLGIVGGLNKIEATVISDAVNLSSRLESLTKKYGVHILISENTMHNLSDISKYSIRFIDRVLVKGKNQPHSIYEVYDNDNAEIKKLKDETKTIYEEALANFHYKKIDVAMALLEKCIEINPYDNPARIYLDRCKEFAKNGFHEGAQELKLQIKWDNSFAVGHAKIDKQHFELFTNSIKLLNAIEHGKGTTEIESIIVFLNNYVIEHFETEEKYLLDNNYPFLDHQIGQHANFIKSFELLKNEILSNKKSKIFLMFRIQTLLVDWVVNHTIKEDKHYEKYIKGQKGI